MTEIGSTCAAILSSMRSAADCISSGCNAMLRSWLSSYPLYARGVRLSSFPFPRLMARETVPPVPSTALRIGVKDVVTHVQGVRLNHAIFASEEVIFSRLGVKDGQKCPFKDSNVAAIMLTTPCGVSGDHPSLTLFAKILLQLVSPPLHVGWDTALFAGKYPVFT